MHLNSPKGNLFSSVLHSFKWKLLLILPLLVSFSLQSLAQQKLKTPIKLNIEDGNFAETSVVVKNSTTGETNTVPGAAKFDLDLKVNCDYVISFSKPGYITKKIQLNTSAPADRISQGFYPFNFEVNLFKQYDGVNIVVFNQPVGKISYNRLIDDFDYDTDYTKQIQSALKAAEDEIIRKQAEERANAEQLKKDAEKKKAEDAAQAKADAKAKQEADKKAAEETRAAQAQAAKDKKLEEDKARKAALAVADEEKKRVAIAKMEEEERAKAKAFEDEEARKKALANSANDSPHSSAQAVTGEDNKPKASSGGGFDEPGSIAEKGEGSNAPGSKAAKGSGIDVPGSKAAKGSGDEPPEANADKGKGKDTQLTTKADPNKRNEKGFTKATGIEGADDQPEAVKPEVIPVAAPPKLENYEVLPDVTVEEIVENNRTITKVTVRKGQKETIFSKVVYTWGGIYYFRLNMSISESLYASSTGLK